MEEVSIRRIIWTLLVTGFILSSLASAQVGTRDDPIPMGTTVNLDDGWQITVIRVIPDATNIVLKENMLNKQPKSGDQFFLARIKAKYIGQDSATFNGLFRLRAVGPSSIGYSAFENSPGVIPDSIPKSEVFTGGIIEGNIGWEIKSVDANSLVMYDSPISFEKDNRRVYMALYTAPLGAVTATAASAGDEAINASDMAIEPNLQNAIDWANKGKAFAQQSKYDEAIKAFDEAIRLKPKYAEAWNGKGNAFHNQREYEEAVKAYDEAIKLKPNYVDAWKNKGNSLYSLGLESSIWNSLSSKKYDEPHELYMNALECYNKTIKADPLDAEAWTMKGFVIDDLNQSNEAERCYETSIDINPAIAEICWYNQRVTTYNSLIGLIGDGAGDCALMAMSLECKSSAKCNPDMNFTEELEKAGSNAILNFDKAVEVDKYYSKLWDRYCQIFKGNCECDELCDNESLKMQLVYNCKGWVLLKMGQYNESIEYFDKALERNPQFLEAWGNKGEAIESLGRTVEAKYAFEKSGGNKGFMPNRDR